MSKKNESALATAADLMNDREKFLAHLSQEEHGSATADEIRDQLGNAPPEIEEIKIKHQGANLIVMPDGEEIKGKEGIACVILASTFHNAFFEHSFEKSEPGERPICKSADAVVVDEEVPQQQAENCSTCPRNRSATSQQAREQAFERDRDECCDNRLTLILAIPGHQMPYKMGLSVKSHGPFRKHATRVGSKTRFLLHEVATRIYFEEVGKFKHSEARFEYLGALPQELREANSEAHSGWLSYLRRTANVVRADQEEASAEAKARAASSVKSEDSPI